MTGPGGIWAVVPIKELRLAKQRLAPRYEPEFRAGLAAAMAADVLEALSEVRGLAGVIVVTVDPEAAKLARHAGSLVSETDARGGHTAVVSSVAAELETRGASAMLALPADIPTVTVREIEDLLQTCEPAPSVTLVPSLDGDGTNAVLASPPTLLDLSFGPGSFVRHVASARQRGVEPRILRLPGIALDIDMPDDLRLLIESEADTRSRRLARAQLLEPAR